MHEANCLQATVCCQEVQETLFFTVVFSDADCVFSDSSLLGVEEYVMDAVTEHNKLAASVDT